MAKCRTGLQKNVSIIFDGMRVPDQNVEQQVVPGAAVESEIEDTQSLPPKQTPPKTPETPVNEKPKPVDAPKESKIETLYLQACEYIKNKVFSPEPGVNKTKKIAMTILVPVLTIILFFTLAKVFRKSPLRKSVRSDQTAKEVIAASTSKINWQRPEPYPTNLRDPMSPANAGIYQNQTNSSTQNGEFYGNSLKGIVFSDVNPAVIIGHKIMHEGDNFAGATIVKINKKNVVFEMNGKRWTQEVGK